MNKGFIKAGALSPTVTVANPDANVKSALNAIKDAVDNNVQIIALPELFVSGYTCGDLFFQHKLLKECTKALTWLLEQTKDISSVIVIGAPVRVRSLLYNCAVVMQSGKILGVIPKSYLPNYDEFFEKRWFTSGIDCEVEEISLCGQKTFFGHMLFELDNGAILGTEICEDLYVPVSPSNIMSLSGANIIVNISANSALAGKRDALNSIIKQQSKKCICAYIHSSAGSSESTTDLVFSGDCTIAENGKILVSSKNSSPACACIDIGHVNYDRCHKTSFADNAKIYSKNYPLIQTVSELPELSDDAIKLNFSALPFIPSDEKKAQARFEEVLDIQIAGLAKRMIHAKFKKAIIGISGGLDSTLTLLVTAKTMEKLNLPAENIICVTMPGFGTTDTTHSSAAELIDAFGATKREVDIIPACIQHMQDIGHDMSIHDATYENIQARERTQILMDMANKDGALLVGTGDMSEMALGWCTYNGDHMSMYCVNAGVPKTLIRHMLAYFASQSNIKVSDVFKKVLDTPVSPELLPPDSDGNILQKTEDTLGPYEAHDFFLYHFLRYGSTPEKILFMAERAFADKYSSEQLKGWLKLFITRFFTNQFKRSCSPDGPKVGSISLSPRGDWKMPSDADFAAWL